MSNSSKGDTHSGVLRTLGMSVGAVATLVIAAPTFAQATFPDIQDHWARPYIEALTARNILAGYPDGTFRPNQVISRDEYAAIVRQAFNRTQVRSATNFEDVPSEYWAQPAIQEAYTTGFMNPPEPNEFQPNQPISRAEALAILVRGLNLAPAAPRPQPTARQGAFAIPQQAFAFLPTQALAAITPRPETPAAAPATPADPQAVVSQRYTDAEQIPNPLVEPVAIAAERGIVVNHPNPNQLNPNQPATRGDASAFIHQALVSEGRIPPLPEGTTPAAPQ